jgi:hypothetical protein
MAGEIKSKCVPHSSLHVSRGCGCGCGCTAAAAMYDAITRVCRCLLSRSCCLSLARTTSFPTSDDRKDGTVRPGAGDSVGAGAGKGGCC